MAIGMFGLTIYVALFSVLLWQRSAAQYRGEELGEAAAPVLGQRSKTNRSWSDVGSRVDTTAAARESVAGIISPNVRAVLRKEYSYLMRNGFAFLLLVLPPAQVLYFSTRLVVSIRPLAARARVRNFPFQRSWHTPFSC